MKFGTILLDPPWQQQLTGRYLRRRHSRATTLPYPTMSVDDIAALPVSELAADESHCWLWTTNQFLRHGFELLAGWGFKYLCPVHWIKPSGCGAWFVSRSQTLLFGYKGKLRMREKYKPNVLFAPSTRHSKKPASTYDLIESVSFGPYLEVFARNTRPEWTAAGNEIDGQDIRGALKDLADAPLHTAYARCQEEAQPHR